jgi:hypothetical protein
VMRIAGCVCGTITFFDLKLGRGIRGGASMLGATSDAGRSHNKTPA